MCAPVERPIQLRCISLIGSGQSRRSRSSSSRSAYAVIRIIHCFRLRLKTGKLPRSERPVGGDLLVGQHGAQAGAPVDRRLGDVGQPVVVDDAAPLGGVSAAQRRPSGVGRVPAANSAISSAIGRALRGVRVVPGVEDLQEDPLGPAVEVGVGGGDRAPLVVRQAQPAQLRAVPLDVRLGGGPRVGAGLHRVLLGGQAERVEAHRVQHVAAGHPLVAGVAVGADVAQRVPDVQARRPTGTGTCPARTASPRRPGGARGRPAARSGSGAWKVPCSCQMSCQRCSISPASAAVYRNGGVSVAAAATSVMALLASVVTAGATGRLVIPPVASVRSLGLAVPGHKKAPRAGGDAVLSRAQRISTAG